ncbi:MAG: penicillin-binding protein 1C [bacterium]|nr:penicillin-binding protein 1C [bacterium]
MTRIGKDIARQFYQAALFEARLRRVALGAAAACAVAAVVFACSLELIWPIPVPRSGELLDRNGKTLFASLNQRDEWLMERGLDRISPYLVQATIAAEDQRFESHFGVDPIAVARAAASNIAHQRVVSGASTLTMQVVKIAGLRAGVTYNKAEQAMLAVKLQTRAGKDDILRLYLNLAPYGGNLIGCEAASRRYFNKPAAELTLPEAALLASLPKAPALYSPLDHPARARERRNYVLQRMRDEGMITDAQYRSSIESRLGAGRYSFPNQAPHLAMRDLDRLRGGETIVSTLDASIQTRAEQLAKQCVKSYGADVENAAAIVIDASSAEVLALVGSADFWNNAIDGQVDVTQSPRSPGSALKPFTYALAMAESKLYPHETLLDDDWDRGRYHPENFNQRYEGVLGAGEALRLSLNIPAVTVLQRTGLQPLHAFLRRAGLSTLTRDAESYGLGLTLGGCEVRLDELAGAYAMLANLGEWRPLRFERNAGPRVSNRLLPRGVCAELFDMMEQPLPGEENLRGVKTINAPERVCWKTGTSAGRRDAWSFVFNRQYVVGVWVGNNSGRSSRRLVGASAALPLAAKLFRSLPDRSTPAWPDDAGDLHPVKVCAISGLPASPWCRQTRIETMPRSVYLHRVCDMHAPDPAREGEVIERWPGSAQNWDLAHINAPIVAQNTAPTHRTRELEILEPASNAQFVYSGDAKGDRIQLRTTLDGGPELHWYLDGKHLGESGRSQPLIMRLEPGDHRLACMTIEGETNVVRFSVATQ